MSCASFCDDDGDNGDCARSLVTDEKIKLLDGSK